MAVDKKTLIYNWVEERQCQPYEEGNRNPDGTLCTNLHRQGHQGILSISAPSCTMETSTTSTLSYSNQPSSERNEKGDRENTLQHKLYKLAEKQVKEEMSDPPILPQEIYKSVTQQDYNKSDFIPQNKPCSRDFNEEPATYWRQNIPQITGITPVPQYARSPFARNTTFSTPIEHSTQNDSIHNTSQ